MVLEVWAAKRMTIEYGYVNLLIEVLHVNSRMLFYTNYSSYQVV